MIESNTPIHNIEKEVSVDQVRRNNVLNKKRRKLPPTEIPNLDRLKESMDFKFKFDSVKDRVKSILRSDIYARKNDLWLLLRYWQAMGQIKIIIPLEEFSNINAAETITRARRKIFEEARTDPSLKWVLTDNIVNEIRREREENMENMFSQEKEQNKAVLVK